MTIARHPFIRLLLFAVAAGGLLVVPSTAAQAKVGSFVSGQILTVKSGRASDHVRVFCDAHGLVKVNGKDPGTGQVACSRVSEVDAVMGPGNDRVDFSAVGSADGFGQRDLSGFGHGTGCAAELGPGNDTYTGGKSCFNLVLGGPGNDRITGGDLRDEIQGGPGNDTIFGGGGNDVLLGNAGDDHIYGGPGDDLISGNAGNDWLYGGPGNDLIGGGPGDDHLFGGPGDDT